MLEGSALHSFLDDRRGENTCFLSAWVYVIDLTRIIDASSIFGKFFLCDRKLFLWEDSFVRARMTLRRLRKQKYLYTLTRLCSAYIWQQMYAGLGDVLELLVIASSRSKHFFFLVQWSAVEETFIEPAKPTRRKPRPASQIFFVFEDGLE